MEWILNNLKEIPVTLGAGFKNSCQTTGINHNNSKTLIGGRYEETYRCGCQSIQILRIPRQRAAGSVSKDIRHMNVRSVVA